MLIHLFSPDEALCVRWKSTLSADYSLQFHQTMAELNYCLYTDKNTVVIIHLETGEEAALPKETLALATANGHKLVCLTNTPSMEEGVRLLANGVRGYSNSYTQPARLLAAIKLVEQGDVWISHQVMQAVTDLAQGQQERINGRSDEAQLNAYCEKYDLLEREHQILVQLLKGETNQEMSRQLNISERTVKARLSTIYQKTDTRNKLELTLSIQKFTN